MEQGNIFDSQDANTPLTKFGTGTDGQQMTEEQKPKQKKPRSLKETWSWRVLSNAQCCNKGAIDKGN